MCSRLCHCFRIHAELPKGPSWSLQVSDFGLSRVFTGSTGIATETYGTVTHMPPELLSEGRLTRGADVYAFGVLSESPPAMEASWTALCCCLAASGGLSLPSAAV